MLLNFFRREQRHHKISLNLISILNRAQRKKAKRKRTENSLQFWFNYKDLNYTKYKAEVENELGKNNKDTSIRSKWRVYGLAIPRLFDRTWNSVIERWIRKKKLNLGRHDSLYDELCSVAIFFLETCFRDSCL